MIRTIKSGASKHTNNELDARGRASVGTIIADIGQRGDAAVRQSSRQFDAWDPPASSA